jgi:tetratricopeptide (TPR) repeat protein
MGRSPPRGQVAPEPRGSGSHGPDSTLDPDAPQGSSDETWVPDAVAPTSPSRDVGLLVNRYRVGRLIGRGGSGQVHRARDVLHGEDVAVKLIRPVGPGVARQIRREVLALRVLALPGVVHLRDDGWLMGQRFLVMDLLEGGPFDGLTALGGWDAWSGQVHALLEILARVHFAGVVHRDLKPANILLDAQGQPVVTDFGLAQGELVESFSGIREGTPRYMAPEQGRGEPCDARADLYAVGVMLAEMVGDGPVPAEVAATLAAMRAADPADRPGSAVEVLAALGADAEQLLGARLAVPEGADEVALRALFDELPMSFLHVAEDGAEVLFARTGGAAEAVRAEVERWVRAGRCHVVGGKIRMERAAVDKLRWEDSAEARALAEVSREADEAGLAAEILATADGLQRRGRNERAMAVLDIGLSALESGSPHRGEILEKLVCAALALADEEALRLAQHRAERAGARGLARLAEGARAKGLGQAERAAALLAEPLEGEPELWRLSFLVLALRNADAAMTDGVLRRGAELCAGDRILEGRWRIWCGNAAYARGSFDEALAHGEAALAVLPADVMPRLAALNNAAMAALEVFDLEQVGRRSGEALDLARALRHPHGEGFAIWLMRAGAYRRGDPMDPEPDVVRAAADVSPRLQAQLAFIEAALALRRGELDVAQRMATLAANGFEGGLPAGALLARVLAYAAGAPRTALDADLDAIPSLPPPMRLEATALLVRAGALTAPEDAASLADAWPTEDPNLRMDVLSLRECLAILAPDISSEGPTLDVTGSSAR